MVLKNDLLSLCDPLFNSPDNFRYGSFVPFRRHGRRRDDRQPHDPIPDTTTDNSIAEVSDSVAQTSLALSPGKYQFQTASLH